MKNTTHLMGSWKSENKVNIPIDGRQVETTPGSMVLESAIEAGIYVPYLCYHPGLKPYAACRMCVIQEEVEVEVERDGQMVKEKQLRPPAASCTMPVRDGMAVTTVNDTLRQLQRGVMEMLSSEPPRCALTCPRWLLRVPSDTCQRHPS